MSTSTRVLTLSNTRVGGARAAVGEPASSARGHGPDPGHEGEAARAGGGASQAEGGLRQALQRGQSVLRPGDNPCGIVSQSPVSAVRYSVVSQSSSPVTTVVA